ncbi:MAG: YgiT-type zinc finger protein [Nitrospirae bacterium]|nr:YgiT-type zinc finger protein [Nitrospirota bacterium]
MILDECPNCGSKKVKYVISDYTIRLARNHRVKIPALRRLRCLKCREEVFDPEAMQVRDHYLSKDPVWQAGRRALSKRTANRRRSVAQAA